MRRSFFSADSYFDTGENMLRTSGIECLEFCKLGRGNTIRGMLIFVLYKMSNVWQYARMCSLLFLILSLLQFMDSVADKGWVKCGDTSAPTCKSSKISSRKPHSPLRMILSSGKPPGENKQKHHMVEYCGRYWHKYFQGPPWFPHPAPVEFWGYLLGSKSASFSPAIW